MANSKHLLPCLILLVLLLSPKLESRPLEASVERKKTTSTGYRELIQKSQLLREGLAKEAVNFPNNYDTERLSPGGPDPRHH